MNYKKAYFSLLFILLGAISSESMARQWRFSITPMGQPHIGGTLFPSGSEGENLNLTYRHELYFNGENFESRMVLLELSSYLIKVSETNFEWRTLDGNAVRFRGDGKFKYKAVEWYFECLGGNEYLIKNSSGTKFIYKNTMLREAVFPGRKYVFECNKNLIEKITMTGPSDNLPVEEVIRLDHNDFGNILGITKNGRALELCYNAKNQLTKCIDPDQDAPLFAANYNDKKLLVHFENSRLHMNYKWGDGLVFTNRSRIHPPLPCVSFDGIYTYKFSTHGNVVECHLYQAKKKAGEWKYNFENSALKIQTLKSLSPNRDTQT